MMRQLEKLNKRMKPQSADHPTDNYPQQPAERKEKKEYKYSKGPSSSNKSKACFKCGSNEHLKYTCPLLSEQEKKEVKARVERRLFRVYEQSMLSKTKSPLADIDDESDTSSDDEELEVLFARVEDS